MKEKVRNGNWKSECISSFLLVLLLLSLLLDISEITKIARWLILKATGIRRVYSSENKPAELLRRSRSGLNIENQHFSSSNIMKKESYSTRHWQTNLLAIAEPIDARNFLK